MFSAKKRRNRQIRKKVVHLEDSDCEEKPISQEGEQNTSEGGSEQPSNGGPVTAVTAAPSAVKEKVGYMEMVVVFEATLLLYLPPSPHLSLSLSLSLSLPSFPILFM